MPTEAEANGIDKFHLYEWTKKTIEDPTKKAKYIKSFSLYVGGREVYEKDKAEALESVREHQAGLQSFRSMRRIDARRKNASALRLRFSQSLASLRQRLSQAMVRSTTQRRGSTTNPLA